LYLKKTSLVKKEENENRKQKKKLTCGPGDVDDVSWAIFWGGPRRSPPPAVATSFRRRSSLRRHGSLFVIGPLARCPPFPPHEQWLVAVVQGGVVAVAALVVSLYIDKT
jgi:hypothetical protein